MSLIHEHASEKLVLERVLLLPQSRPPRSGTAKVPIVLLGMCTGMVGFQSQQRPCQVGGIPTPLKNMC